MQRLLIVLSHAKNLPEFPLNSVSVSRNLLPSSSNSPSTSSLAAFVIRTEALEVLTVLLVASSGFLKPGTLTSGLAAFEAGPVALVLDSARLLSDLITGMLLLDELETEAGLDLEAEFIELGADWEAACVDLFRTGAAAAVGASCSIWAAPF